MKTILTILVLSSFAASAHYFMPKNNFKIPVGYTTKAFGVEPVTEEVFNSILDQVEEVY